jgi:OOP family OmpA-OmpF porin
MHFKLNKTCLGAAGISIVALAIGSAAFAQQPEHDVISAGTGNAVKDPFGKCVHAVGGAVLPECNPIAVAAPEPVPAPIVVSLAADTNFAFDKYDLKPAGEATLDRLVSDINQAARVDGIDIVGHTDNVGSEAYNQVLSERRAQSVANYLASRGVNPSLINTKGESFRQPIASNDTPAGRAQNRRVDVTVDAKEVPQG